MAFGFKAFSSASADGLVLDDTFSTWTVSASGTMAMPFTGSLTATYPGFNSLTKSPPAVFVKIPTTGVWGLIGQWGSSTSSPTNTDLINVGQIDASGFNTGVMDYRIYEPATTQLIASLVKTGHGLNIFDANGKPTFASSVKPLIFDYVGQLDSGVGVCAGSSGYIGTEIDLGISSPWIYVLATKLETVVFLNPQPPIRGVTILVPAYYHVNGTCRARYYRYSFTVTAGITPYSMISPSGDTFKKAVFALSS